MNETDNNNASDDAVNPNQSDSSTDDYTKENNERKN